MERKRKIKIMAQEMCMEMENIVEILCLCGRSDVLATDISPIFYSFFFSFAFLLLSFFLPFSTMFRFLFVLLE